MHGDIDDAASVPVLGRAEPIVEQPAVPGALPDRPLHSDPHDFAGLYIRHRSSFTLHARRYLRDPRDADEVVQESFLRLFLALPELETELQALAYCRRTITNLCIDRYRAQARRPSLVALDSVPVDELAEADTGDPVIRAEDAATVREALSLLSPLHRAALVKREIEEKPLPQIALELDIAEDSVKHVLFRARRALRRILATTSLAPGADGERSGNLLKALSKGSGGVAGLVMLLALGLGAGPNLKSIPVAGSVLPDLPSIGQVVRAVDKALTNLTTSPSTASGSMGAADGPQGGPQAGGGPGGPLVLASPSSSPGAVSATATVGTMPRGEVLPGTAPSPSLPSAIPSPTDLPVVRPSVEPSRQPVVRVPDAPSLPVAPLADGKPRDSKPKDEPVASRTDPLPVQPTVPKDDPSKAPAKDTTSKDSGAKDSKPTPAPKPTLSPDPSSWKTAGLVYQNDPTTQQPVLAAAGDKPGFDS